jgi:crotonobetainyl-CoA:carnitine CoA-transferase CaiB-like acyl-CoA transferase
VTRQGPLSGVRVVDMASVVAGPGAARHLADFGADVIKVEPPGGDTTRRLGWTQPGEADSLFWKIIGRGKRCVTLDLKSDDGHREMLRILSEADLLIENMRPGKLERLELGPEILLKQNPRIVILRVSGFGQTGPYAGHAGFATTAEALSGFADLSGEATGPPLLPPVALTDEVTALAGAFAATAALMHAARTGEGQVIDVSLLESMINLLGPLPSAFLHLGYQQRRMGSGIPYSVPRGTYLCSDGVWVAVSSTADSVADRVLSLLGLSDDERFRTVHGRMTHRELIEERLTQFIATRPSDEVLALFREADAAINPVYTIGQMVEDVHVQEREILVEVDGLWMQRPIARFSRTPVEVLHAGRELGADTTSILLDPWGTRGADETTEEIASPSGTTSDR